MTYLKQVIYVNLYSNPPQKKKKDHIPTYKVQDCDKCLLRDSYRSSGVLLHQMTIYIYMIFFTQYKGQLYY